MAVKNEYSRFGALGGFVAGQETNRQAAKEKADIAFTQANTQSTLINAQRALEELATYRQDAPVRAAKRQSDIATYETNVRTMARNERTEIMQEVVQGLDAVESQDDYDAFLQQVTDRMGNDAYKKRLKLSGNWEQDRDRLDITYKAMTDTLQHRQAQQLQGQADAAAMQRTQAQVAGTLAAQRLSNEGAMARTQAQIAGNLALGKMGNEARLAEIRAQGEIDAELQTQREGGLDSRLDRQLNAEADRQEASIAAQISMNDAQLASADSRAAAAIKADSENLDKQLKTQMELAQAARDAEAALQKGRLDAVADENAKNRMLERAKLAEEVRHRAEVLSLQKDTNAFDKEIRREQVKLQKLIADRRDNVDNRALDAQIADQAARVGLLRDEQANLEKYRTAELDVRRDSQRIDLITRARQLELDQLRIDITSRDAAYDRYARYSQVQMQVDAQERMTKFNAESQIKLQQLVNSGRIDAITREAELTGKGPSTDQVVAASLLKVIKYEGDVRAGVDGTTKPTESERAIARMFRIDKVASAILPNLPPSVMNNPTRVFDAIMATVKGVMGDAVHGADFANAPVSQMLPPDWAADGRGTELTTRLNTMFDRVKQQFGDKPGEAASVWEFTRAQLFQDFKNKYQLSEMPAHMQHIISNRVTGLASDPYLLWSK